MVSFNVTAPAVFLFIVASLPRLIVALRRSSALILHSGEPGFAADTRR